jgi:serine/threonine protein kinase
LLAGRYLIVRKIADGGFSAVYYGEDMRLGNCPVAIKEMAVRAHGTNPQAIQQAVADFQQEAELLAHVNHPNLPRVLDRFEEGGRQFLIMDFIEGHTLEQTLAAANGPLTEAQVLQWAAQLCDVLQFLHEQQPPIIYRDLKPANVMLQFDGTIKLIDFGIARFYKPGKTSDTTAFGTPGYAPPEQFGSGQSDARADIYALGAMLYQLLTAYDIGATPFNFPPARQINPAIAPRVDAALAQATRANAAERFGGMVAFKRALGLASGAQPPISTPTPIPTAAPVPKRRGSFIRAALMLGLVLIGGMGTGGTMLWAFAGRAAPATATTPAVAVQATGTPSVTSRQVASSVATTSVVAPVATIPSAPETASTLSPAETVVFTTPTESPTPTPTWAPTPTSTPTAVDIRVQIEAALQNYNDRRAEALRTANAVIFDDITSGAQRDKEVRTISSDIATGAHHEISILASNVDDVQIAGDTEAYITVTKTEDRLFFPQGCPVPDDTDPCRRPANKQNTHRNETYTVRYRMLKLGDVWKVDGSEVRK